MDRRDIDSLCRGFDDIALDPMNPGHARAVLDAEHQRRLYAYVFERRAHGLLRAAGLDAADGWHIGWVGDEPRHWFRLYGPDEPVTDIDLFVNDWLVGRGCTVTTTRYVPGIPGLYGRVIGTTLAGPLHEIMARLDGARDSGRCAEDPDRDDPRMHAEALAAVEALGDWQLSRIALARLFMNCYLERWFPYRAADVDAIFRHPNGRLIVVECKRKHPARNRTIGLDKQGVRLLNWLGWHDARMVNLVLVNPVWNGEYDPGRLLDPALSDAGRAAWIAAALHPGQIVGTNRTVGKQSGMHKGMREQSAFPLRVYGIVGEGLEPDGSALRDWFLGHDMPSAVRLIKALAPA